VFNSNSTGANRQNQSWTLNTPAPVAKSAVSPSSNPTTCHQASSGAANWNVFSGTTPSLAPMNSTLPTQNNTMQMCAPGVFVSEERVEVPIPAKGLEVAPVESSMFEKFCDDDLLSAIRDLAAPTREICYTGARKAMFSDVDNVEGDVDCIYTTRRVTTSDIPDADGPQGMNTEHTWPMSKGVRDTRAKSDMHHLFPSNSNANSKRSSFPFGKVETVRWELDGSKLGLNAAGVKVFEPAEESRGNIARAMFYVAAVYELEIPPEEEAVLRQWHEEDPVDENERARNSEISTYQGNRNPFVDDESLVRRVSEF